MLSASAVGNQLGSTVSPSQTTGAPANNGATGSSTSNVGNSSGAGAAESSTAVSSVPAASGNYASTTLAAQLQAAQSTQIVGDVPSATGFSAPVPAVVAVFTAQHAPTDSIVPVAPLRVLTFVNPPPKPIPLTGGDVQQNAPAPTKPLGPALPPTSSDLSNEARDQVLQEFARPKEQQSEPVDTKTIDRLLRDITEPDAPAINPARDLNDDQSRVAPPSTDSAVDAGSVGAGAVEAPDVFQAMEATPVTRYDEAASTVAIAVDGPARARVSTPRAGRVWPRWRWRWPRLVAWRRSGSRWGNSEAWRSPCNRSSAARERESELALNKVSLLLALFCPRRWLYLARPAGPALKPRRMRPTPTQLTPPTPISRSGAARRFCEFGQYREAEQALGNLCAKSAPTSSGLMRSAPCS